MEEQRSTMDDLLENMTVVSKDIIIADENGDNEKKKEAIKQYSELYRLYLQERESDININFHMDEMEQNRRKEKNENVKFWVRAGIDIASTISMVTMGVITTKHSVEFGNIAGDPTKNWWLGQLFKKK